MTGSLAGLDTGLLTFRPPRRLTWPAIVGSQLACHSVFSTPQRAR